MPYCHSNNWTLRYVYVRPIWFLVLWTSFTDRHKAHTLLAFAERDAGREAQNKLQEILFRHYFTDGRYPDEANLRAAAVEAGLDPERAMAAVADQGGNSTPLKMSRKLS